MIKRSKPRRTKRKLSVLYARFSPRPIPVTCPHCGNTYRVEAGDTEVIAASCPRCKTPKLVQNCDSCESQLIDLRHWAVTHGYDVAGEFHDNALSGGDDWESRPGMLDAMTACRPNMTFLVRSYDRLFRNVDKALAFRATLEAKGVSIVSTSPQEAAANGDSMNAKLIRFVILWKAELDREITRARTRAKMQGHQAGGRRMSRHPPFGSQVDPANPKLLIPNPEEIATVEIMQRLHSEGLGVCEIARQLEARGISRRGRSTWTHQLVAAALARAETATSSAGNTPQSAEHPQ
jgi:site-specific DNA recombinase